MALSDMGVNLPRWGLKRIKSSVGNFEAMCVNLPRWGLKRT